MFIFQDKQTQYRNLSVKYHILVRFSSSVVNTGFRFCNLVMINRLNYRLAMGTSS